MADLAGANTYFEDTFFSSVWTEYGEKERLQAINTAVNQLSLLDNVIEERYGEDGLGDKEDKFIYEQARFLLSLDEEDLKRIKLQATGVTKFNSEQFSEDYDKDEVIMVAGLPLSPDLKQALFPDEEEEEIEEIEELIEEKEEVDLSPGDML